MTGLYEDTLILFGLDHGDLLVDHHHWRKCYVYEGSALVQRLVRWLDGLVTASRGQVRDKVAGLREIMPTFLVAACIDVPDSLEGRSLLDPIAGKAGGWRDVVDLEHSICYSPRNHWSALTDGSWKYTDHAPNRCEELFDLKSELGEERDFAEALGTAPNSGDGCLVSGRTLRRAAA